MPCGSIRALRSAGPIWRKLLTKVDATPTPGTAWSRKSCAGGIYRTSPCGWRGCTSGSGNLRLALQLTNRVVNETREYDPNVFQMWQRLGGTQAQVFERGVGNNTAAGRGYFLFLLASGDAAATGNAWTELKNRGMAGVDESRFYAESLTNSHSYEQAARIESAILPEGIWNGGFENSWTGQGLDWKVDSITGVEVSRDTAERHSGAASLRLEFDGRSRDEFAHASESRVLPPGRWIVRAMIRTDLKGTASQALGIGLRVQDPVTGRILAETNRIDGKSNWTAVEATLDAGTHAQPGADCSGASGDAAIRIDDDGNSLGRRRDSVAGEGAMKLPVLLLAASFAFAQVEKSLTFWVREI